MVPVTVEDGYEIVGDNHRYQITIAIILFLVGIISDVPFHAVPVMETNPIVTFQSNNQTYTEILNYTICNNYNYTINTTASKSTWLIDYDMSCNKLYVSSIGFFTLLGGLFGTILLHFLQTKSRKWPFIIMGLMMSLASVLLIPTNLILLLIYNAICGMAGIMIYIWRINTTSEITNRNYRSYYNNLQMTSSTFCLVLIFTLFNYDVNWRIFFFGSAILLAVFLFFFHRFYIENPRFHYLKKDKDKMLNSFLQIARFNRVDKDPLFESKINTFMRYITFGDSSKYEIAMNSPPKHNVIKIPQENSIVNVYTSQSERVNTRLNSEHEVEIEKKLNRNCFIKSEKFVYFNFIISAPLCSFLAFIYNFEIKKFSYDVNSKIYFFAFFSIIILLFFVSPIMNIIGRKLSKLITLSVFFSVLILVKINTGIFSESFMYLMNRMFIHLTNHINLTHLNESFPTSKRLHVFNLTHLISKVLLLSAPLIYEYLENYRFIIEISIIIVLIICFLFQEETANKKLQDN